MNYQWFGTEGYDVSARLARQTGQQDRPHFLKMMPLSNCSHIDTFVMSRADRESRPLLRHILPNELFRRREFKCGDALSSHVNRLDRDENVEKFNMFSNEFDKNANYEGSKARLRAIISLLLFI